MSLVTSLVMSRWSGSSGLSPVGLTVFLACGVPALAAAIGGSAVVAFDGLALAACALTLFVGGIVAVFSVRYMRADRRSLRYFATMGLLLGSVNLFALSSNLLVLAAAWSASGWLLVRLIGHDADWAEAAAAARRARRTFLIGDVALFGAVLLLTGASGTAQADRVLAGIDALPAGLTGAAALLLLIAAMARCALPPLSGWLLSSMTAPTPVSALMHAGLVNAGGFLLIRFAPVLEAAPAVRVGAVAVGLFAALYGLGIMMVRPDVKRALAGSTVSQMGFMIMSCGIGAYAAALWHLIAHGLFKAWLFLGAGSAIGIKAGGRAAGPADARIVTAIALATLAAGAILAGSQAHAAALVPLLLGGATAAASLIAALGGAAPLRARVALAAGVVLLIGFHAAGLTLAHAAVGGDGAPLLPPVALVAILGAFLGSWVWQQQRLHRAAALPLPLYVHLLNAGALTAPHKGEA